jgi:hypothetical protein
VLQVVLPGCKAFNYKLPGLNSEELARVRHIEQLLRSAAYKPGHFVPIFWDTETTGLGSNMWWLANGSRVVQVGAHTLPEHGGQDIKLRVNPWPVPMSQEAAATTGMSTDDVWKHPLPPQVRTVGM